MKWILYYRGNISVAQKGHSEDFQVSVTYLYWHSRLEILLRYCHSV